MTWLSTECFSQFDWDRISGAGSARSERSLAEKRCASASVHVDSDRIEGMLPRSRGCGWGAEVLG